MKNDHKNRIINLELTQNEEKFVKLLALMQCEGAEDNLATITPIHVVERQEKEWIYGTGDTWIWPDNDFAEYSSFEELLADIMANEIVLAYTDDQDQDYYLESNNINAERCTAVITYRPVAFFLVYQEAVRYKEEYQAHNCQNCRVYTYSLGYGNQGDLPVLRELLMKIGKQILKG